MEDKLYTEEPLWEKLVAPLSSCPLLTQIDPFPVVILSTPSQRRDSMWKSPKDKRLVPEQTCDQENRNFFKSLAAPMLSQLWVFEGVIEPGTLSSSLKMGLNYDYWVAFWLLELYLYSVFSIIGGGMLLVHSKSS